MIWTQVLGTPEKLADMVLTDTQLRITKTSEAMDANVPGGSLLFDLAGERQFVYDRVESRALPPQLLALLPPPDNANPQRRIIMSLLERRKEIRGLPFALQQWEMLLFAGRNGIGHLDVFERDDVARTYYAKQTTQQLRPSKGSEIWFAFRKFVEQTANEEEEDIVIQMIGPTPGVSGFAPKLISEICLDATHSWTGKTFGNNPIPAIVKIEQPLYPGLLALEELAYDYHRRAKIFDVPRTWLTTIEHGGEPLTMLASERFDRQGGKAIPQESFFSLLHTGNRNKYHCNTDGSMEDIAKLFAALNLPSKQKEEWFSRFVMAVLTGNGDLHTENMAIVGEAGNHHLSPVYDPAPMRAYRGRSSHNILSALPFAGHGGVLQSEYLPYAASGDTPENLGNLLKEFGKRIGIPSKKTKDSIAYLLRVTQNFREEAISILEGIPPELRRNKLAPDIDGFSTTLDLVRKAVSNNSGHPV